MGHMELREPVVDQMLAAMAKLAKSMGAEDWQAGGSLPDLLHDLKRAGHISDQLYVDGCRLVADMQRICGSSAGLVSSYGDQVDASPPDKRLPRFAPASDASRRVSAVLQSMREHERELLRWCVLSREMARGKLDDWGRQHSGFKTRQQTKALAVGQIRSMLETISDAYRYRVPIAA